MPSQLIGETRRHDKDEYGVLQYSLRSEFQSPLLRRYLPNYEWTGLTILIETFLD
jgi:hypothetical protein